MADFQLKVTAETQKAEKDLQRLDKTANEATKGRKLNIDIGQLNKDFRDVEKNVKEAGNTIQTFYRISKNIPGIGDRVREFENLAKGTANLAKNAPASAAALHENAKAGSILANSFEAAGTGAGRLVTTLAKTGLAIFAVKEAVGVLQSAFGGFFNETIGREIKLRETILKTQTTLASTNKVFRNGSEITDPYEKIVALTGEVQKRIDSIRERSIALAGVTSNDVIEVFGIVASQVSQIGGGLKDAEDLAINFAAALGTFNIPLYQARQEIGSILRGDITMDSYLAKALGITNEDVTKAKSQAGGVIKFLEERLAAAVAGQRIAAQGFAGVVSNIKDLTELVSQRFGAGLLDPLLGGLTKVFDFLFKIREEVFAIASGMGRGLGQLLSTNLTAIGGGSALFSQIGAGAEGFAASIAESVKKAFASLQRDANAFIAPLRNLFEEIAKSVGLVGAGLARLAQGFISIKIENFKALVQILSNLSEAVTVFSAGLGQVLRAYGQLLQVPVVQYLSQITAQFQLLERLGVMSAVKLGFAAAGLIAAWQPIVTFFQALAARIAALIGGMVVAVGGAFARMGALIAAYAGTLTATTPAVETLKTQLMGLSTALTSSGMSAEKAGVSIARFGGATTTAVKGVATAVLGFIKFNLILLGIQLAVTALIDLFGRWQKAKDKEVSDKRAQESLQLLSTKYKDIGDNATAATKAAKSFHETVVNARYQSAINEVEELSKKLAELEDDMTKPVRWALDGWFKNWAMNRIPEVKKELERALKERDKYAGAAEKQQTEENIRLLADKRVNLEKEIKELQRQQQNELFQQRQALAQKEVEIFRAAGELRIFQMEQANKKLIDGEQGASRTALEALNNYLSVRERGELEIEGAKKQLNIELANLEKQISDYRLENEKKIAEIRKRAGDYEQKVATYRRQVEGQIAAGEGGGAAEFGRTGRTSVTDPNWAHAHFQTTTGTLADVIKDVIPVVKALTDKGIPVELSDGTRIQAGKGDDYYTQILRNAARQHGHSGDGRSLDFNVPAGTKVPVPLTDVRGPNGRLGVNGILPGSGKTFVGHLTRGSRSGGAASIPPPQAPSIGDVGAPAVEEYQTAVRSLGSALERLRALQAALTNARTKEAFEAIARSVFNPVDLEQYDDRLQEVQLTYLGIANASRDAYDPERSKIAIDRVVQETAARRELMQFTRVVNESTLLSEQEKSRIIADITKRHQTYVTSLRDEEVVQKGILAIQRGSEAILKLRNETSDIYKELEVTRLRNRLEAEGVSPERIAAEEDKLRIRQWLNKEQDRLNLALEQERKRLQELQAARAPATEAEKRRLQDELAKALARIKDLEAQLKQLPKEGQNRAAAADAKADATQDPVQSLIGRWKRELADTRAMVVSLAQSIQSELGSAMSNAVTGVLEGTSTVQEAFAQMFRNIGKAFLDMAVQMITKALIMKALGILFPGAGPAALVQGVDVPIAQMPAGMQFRASGGPVSAGRPYIVGERGPELFTSDRSGSIIPNHALGGVQVGSVNITVENTGDALSPTAQKQIAGQVKGIVLATLADQKRGGGMLR